MHFVLAERKLDPNLPSLAFYLNNIVSVAKDSLTSKDLAKKPIEHFSVFTIFFAILFILFVY